MIDNTAQYIDNIIKNIPQKCIVSGENIEQDIIINNVYYALCWYLNEKIDGIYGEIDLNYTIDMYSAIINENYEDLEKICLEIINKYDNNPNYKQSINLKIAKMLQPMLFCVGLNQTFYDKKTSFQDKDGKQMRLIFVNDEQLIHIYDNIYFVNSPIFDLISFKNTILEQLNA